MRGFSIEVLVVCKSQWPSNEEREGPGLDGYKILPSQYIPTTTLCISMADLVGFGDTLPSEWYEVSISATYLPNPRPQDSAFVHAAHKFGFCRLRGDFFLPEDPRTIGLPFTRPRARTYIRTHLRRSVEYAIDPRNTAESSPFSWPKLVEPSAPNPRPSP